MRKRLTTRIIGLAVLYCIVFFVLVVIQFSNKGHFSIFAGNMNIKGRYLEQKEYADTPEKRSLAGGIKIYFGGLEFSLSEERGKGMTLSTSDGNRAINPTGLTLIENTAHFELPDGSVLVFNSLESTRGHELQINVEFAPDAIELSIPITRRRSSLVRDNGQLGISYSGTRYSFSTPGQELETGTIVLSRDNSFIGYRSRGRQKAFDPADFIIAQAQNYESAVVNWRDISFTYWQQNPSSLQNDDNVTAYCSESFYHNSYPRVVESIPASFLNSQNRTHRSSAFVGGMTTAFNSLNSLESAKIDLITRQTRDRSLNFLREEHILDYLYTRSSSQLVSEVVNILQNAEPQMLTFDYCAGLLEAAIDFRRWRPASSNPAEHLTEQAFNLISENLSRDPEKDLVFVSNNDLEYGIRLGIILIDWARINQDVEWMNIGRSLVLSALAYGSAGGASGGNGKLYNALKTGDYYPRDAFVADNGIWAWTVSPFVRGSYIEGNLNITFSFPAGLTHHVIIRGVRPFIKIQIHEMDWRSDSQFERYDSSGWIYYPQEQTLVLKMRHRENTENVRIFYRVDAPALAPVSESASASEDAPTRETDTGEKVEP